MGIARRSLAWSLALACVGAGASAQPDTETPVERPKHQLLRFNEDWSVLRDAPAEERAGFWDPIKFVPLAEDGSVWASFGGHTRARVENWSSFAFGAPKNDDDTFLLWRLTLHGDLHVGENLRVFAEGITALSSDRDLPGGRRTLDVDVVDLEQAFADVRFPFENNSSFTLRAGRQQFLFGKQRLVSPLPWSNTMRRWDGVTAIYQVGVWRIDGFWSQFAPVRKYEFDEPDAQTQFFGVYAAGALPGGAVKLDLYFLGLDRDDPITFNGTTGDEERYTLGVRVYGKIGETPFDYDAEGAYQFGEVGSGDVDAFMIGSDLGLRLADAWASPRLFLGFDYATGDDRAGGDVETFNQLFPLGHAFYGYMDFVGRQNAIDLSLGASCGPLPRMTVGLTGHFLWRESDEDALYNAGGGVVRAGDLGSSSEIGQELDFTVKYRFDDHLTGLFGYSLFFAGDFIEQSGANDDMDFVYAQLQYTF